ncbi:MAG TPA: response regulator [Nitrospira sp.]|nr:response regulator [Nitrospira sp.]
MGNLACGVAHDFNNLITAINGFADLVVHDLLMDTRAHNRMLQIRKAGQRAMAITQHLLALGKTTTKDPAIVDMNLLLTDMERMIQLMIGVRRKVTIVLNPFLGRVKGNPRELEQALLILSMNIAQGREEDVHLQIETRTWSVDGKDAKAMGLIHRGPFIAIAVRAISPGESMPKSSAPQCLTFRENEAIGEDEEKFGMSAVLKIVAEHQGYCFVSQDDTEVNEYTLVFPVARIAQDMLAFNNTAELPLRSGSETVLVVDDEDTVRTLIRELLEANGYRVLEASDGTEALRVGEQHKDGIDLLIVDEIMPGLSGHELTAQMAEMHPRLCALPMSTVKPQFVGEKPFLMKPFTVDVLLKRVDEALQDGPIGHATALQS